MKILALCNSLITLWKVSKYGVFSGLYFPVFELNTDIYSVNLRILHKSPYSQSEYSKMQTRKNSVLRTKNTFHAVYFNPFWANISLLHHLKS